MSTQPARPWDSPEAAEIWRQGAARRAQTLAQATESLLDAAALQPGMRVLDVAAGTGDQTLLVAERIGPTGSILATDISPTMLAAADQNARDAGLSNVTTLVSDASALELPEAQFDAAICRFGLMFVPDLHQCLSRIHHALKPRARFAALVWATRDRNPWMDAQIGVLTEIGCPPAPGVSLLQATSLGEPDRLLQALATAGFGDVQTSRVATPRNFDSLAEAVNSVHTSSPAQAEVLRRLSETERERYLAAIESRLTAFSQPNGKVHIPGEAILAVATR
jgi:SAM-dependent methyltransferase